MITRRGFFRGLLAAATTVVARAYVPSALQAAPVDCDHLIRKMIRAMDRIPREAPMFVRYNQQVVRMMVYGDGWENPNRGEVYGAGPLRSDVAILDSWSQVDDQIAQLG